ncbi:MAG TPA: penicillin acylase family protein [Gemmatales bacterium]|nr:penicillin acylase family protein [Gemmatales bacterium]
MKSHASLALFVMTSSLLGLVSLAKPDSLLAERPHLATLDARYAKMASTVTIYRDRYGVAHVYAPTDEACIFGFMYAQAEDYLWQVEDNYLRALGRASEAYGEKSLLDDLLNRALEVVAVSKKEYETASPRIKAFCQAAVDGLNYYLATHPGERTRVIDKFEPWHPLAFRRFALYQLFIYQKSGLNPVDILKTVKEIKDGHAENITLTPEALLTYQKQAEERALHEEHMGSNMWAVRPEKSVSGKAMLFINPHQPFFGPGQWYEGHLISEQGWNLLGAGFFGSPFPTIGYNGYLAWSHTVNNPDIVDTYAIKLNEEKGTYRFGENDRPVTRWKDSLKIQTESGLVEKHFEFTKTHHGPIVAIRDNVPLAIRLAKFESSGGLEEWYNMGRAKSIAEFRAAMAPCEIPMFNAMVADIHGDIFYVYNGAIPKRSTKFDWSKPVDGSNPETEWQGYHTFDELPQMMNPKCGFLQNCNQQPLTTTPVTGELKPGEVNENPKESDFPPYMIKERDRDNGRAQISRRILHNTEKFDFETWAKAGFNTKVIIAEKQLPDVVKAFESLSQKDPERAARLKEAIDMIREWDCVSTIDSIPMTLFALTYDKVMQMMQKRDLLNFPRMRALEATLEDLQKSHNTWKVAWGEINRLQRIHGSQIDMTGKGAFRDDQPSLPVAGSPGPLGIVFNFYSFPQAGQKRRYGVAGHSYVGVVELAEKPIAKTVLQFGQSGDPQSPHWFDQAQLYAKGQFKPSWYQREEIEANSKVGYHPGEQRK